MIRAGPLFFMYYIMIAAAQSPNIFLECLLEHLLFLGFLAMF